MTAADLQTQVTAPARKSVLRRQFSRPSGLLGWLVGQLMAVKNMPMNRLAVEMLEVQAGDRVLEVGFGPGAAIRLLAESTPAELIAGVDPSTVMLRQANHRNRAGIRAGRVQLRDGTAGRIPFPDAHFTKAFAVNTFHHWSSHTGDLHDVRRVLRDGGHLLLCLRMALPRKSLFAAPGFTEEGVAAAVQLLGQAGFHEIRTVRREVGRTVTAILARKGNVP